MLKRALIILTIIVMTFIFLTSCKNISENTTIDYTGHEIEIGMYYTENRSMSVEVFENATVQIKGFDYTNNALMSREYETYVAQQGMSESEFVKLYNGKMEVKNQIIYTSSNNYTILYSLDIEKQGYTRDLFYDVDEKRIEYLGYVFNFD